MIEPYASPEEARAAAEKLIQAGLEMIQSQLNLCLWLAQWSKRGGIRLFTEEYGSEVEALRTIADELDVPADTVKHSINVGLLCLQLGIADLDLADEHVRDVLMLALAQISSLENDDAY